jgi:hypothetical protein
MSLGVEIWNSVSSSARLISKAFFLVILAGVGDAMPSLQRTTMWDENVILVLVDVSQNKRTQ